MELMPRVRGLPLADHTAVKRALAEADLATLMAVLVQLSGEEIWLERCAPHIKPIIFDGAPLAGGGASIPAELGDQMRARLYDVLTGANPPPQRPIDSAIFQRIASVYMGEPVADEFVDCTMEQSGFVRFLDRDLGDVPAERRDFKVAIVGAGLTGIAMAIRLSADGYSCEIFDRNPDVGGTWFENQYPGVGVDTPSHYYSFSFELNPDWSHTFSSGDQVLAYLQRCAEQYDLYRKTRFSTEVVSLVYDDAAELWNVKTKSLLDGSERTVTANAVINAVGHTNGPKIPEFAGFEDLEVPWVHSARWHKDIDLHGKRVGLIGTGCSSMQIAVTIGPDVEQLTIFQRSAHWIRPVPINVVPEGAKWALRHIPYYGEWFRFRTYWTASDGNYVNVQIDPDWHMPNVSVSRHNEALRQRFLAHLENKMGDRPELMAKMIPDFPPYGKRTINDIGWCDLLRKDSVELETSGISHFVKSGVVTNDGRTLEFDFLILATGFQHVRMLHPLHIVGRNGVDLHDLWGEEDARAYKGVAVPHFPNLFLAASGPNTSPNHGAGANFVSEAHVHYIAETLNAMLARGARTIEVRQDAHDEYNAAIDDALKGLVWSHPKVRSYYVNSKGRPYLSCPYRLVDSWHMMRSPDLSHYHLSPPRVANAPEYIREVA